MSYTIELIYRVYDDSNGSHIHIGPDEDGLDLMDIRYVDDQGKTLSQVTMPRAQGAAVAEAITKYLAQRPNGN